MTLTFDIKFPAVHANPEELDSQSATPLRFQPAWRGIAGCAILVEALKVQGSPCLAGHAAD
jgi:hypothetical protein